MFLGNPTFKNPAKFSSHPGYGGIPDHRRRQGLSLYRKQGDRWILRDQKRLLLPSKLGHILAALPELRDYTAEEGAFLPYKGRSYCWLSVTADGLIRLTKPMMDFLRITPGMRLLSIRSSDIAFTMGARGPLLEKADRYNGVIPEF